MGTNGVADLSAATIADFYVVFVKNPMQHVNWAESL